MSNPNPRTASRGPRWAWLVPIALVALLVAPQPWNTSQGSAAAAGTTLVKSVLPTEREGSASATDGTYVYVFGGRSNGKVLPDIVRYDPTTDTSTLLSTKLPEPLEGAAAVFIGGKAYVFGGGKHYNYVFDPAASTAKKLSARLPDDLSYLAAGTDGRYAYVFGGADGTRSAAILRYDPAADKITTLAATLPTPRGGLSAVSVDSTIYLFGGKDSVRRSDILRFDTSSGLLSTMHATLPTGREATSAFYIAPYAYIVGGRDDAGRLNQIVRFHPASDTVSTMDWRFPTERENTAATAFQGHGYVFGGRDNGHRLNEIVRIDADSGAPQDLVAESGPAMGQIQLTWQPPAPGTIGSPVLGYRVWRSATPGGESVVATVGADALSFLDSGLPNSVARYYVVSAFTSTGETGNSNEAYAYTFEGPPPPLPSPREGTDSVWIQGRAFVFGGNGPMQAPTAAIGDSRSTSGSANTDPPLGQIVEYNPETGEVTVLDQSLPAGCCGTSVATDLFVYLFGGDGGQDRCCDDPSTDSQSAGSAGLPNGDAIYRFDPNSGELTVLGATLPSPACCLAGVYDGSDIWLFGGDNGTDRCCDDANALASGAGVATDNIWKFDPVTETISTVPAHLPTPECCFAAIFDGDAAYIFGGSSDGTDRCCEAQSSLPGVRSTGLGLGGPTTDEIVKFDPDTLEVTVLGVTLPTPRCCMSAVWDGNEALIFGGEGDADRCCSSILGDSRGSTTPEGVQYDDILSFNPVTQTIRTLSDTLPSARSATSAVWSGQRAYVFGGDVNGTATEEVVGYNPGAPQAVKATPGPGRGQVTLSWDPPADGSAERGLGYRVYAGDASGAIARIAQTSLVDRAYLDAPLGDGQTRFYKVSLFFDHDEGPTSKETSATTFRGPSAPQDLEATFEVGSVVLSWQAPADAGGAPIDTYRIHRHTDLDPTEVTIVVPGSQTTYTDEACQVASISCYYSVSAVNIVGEGPRSNEASALGSALPGVWERDTLAREAAPAATGPSLPFSPSSMQG